MFVFVLSLFFFDLQHKNYVAIKLSDSLHLHCVSSIRHMVGLYFYTQLDKLCLKMFSLYNYLNMFFDYFLFDPSVLYFLCLFLFSFKLSDNVLLLAFISSNYISVSFLLVAFVSP